jgi:hypothetical protein
MAAARGGGELARPKTQRTLAACLGVPVHSAGILAIGPTSEDPGWVPRGWCDVAECAAIAATPPKVAHRMHRRSDNQLHHQQHTKHAVAWPVADRREVEYVPNAQQVKVCAAKVEERKMQPL